MIDRLNDIEKKYNELTELLATQEVLANFNKMKSLSKEQKDLEETVNKYKEYKNILNGINETKEMMKDEEYRLIATEELEELENKKEIVEQELNILLIPKDDNDTKDVIMVIRGAAGGDEANIFAGDLFRMYSRYFEKNGWHIEILNAIEGTSGGYAQIEFRVSGENVYSKLKFESGSHRVQRVPDTETQGRVHTSTSTVLVMPEADEVSIEIKENDLKIDVFHSSGAGGQSVNTSDSAVRITHVPTGVVVGCQTERSQLKNKEKAMGMLRTKLYDLELQKKELEEGNARRNKIGTGDRSEKIRTYNYPQNRVTDHRINYTTMDLDKVMDGHIEGIIEALITEDQRLKLENV